MHRRSFCWFKVSGFIRQDNNRRKYFQLYSLFVCHIFFVFWRHDKQRTDHGAFKRREAFRLTCVHWHSPLIPCATQCNVDLLRHFAGGSESPVLRDLISLRHIKAAGALTYTHRSWQLSPDFWIALSANFTQCITFVFLQKLWGIREKAMRWIRVHTDQTSKKHRIHICVCVARSMSAFGVWQH